MALSTGLAAALALGAGCSSSSSSGTPGGADSGDDGASSGSSSGTASSSGSGSTSSSGSSSGTSSSSSGASSSGASDASSDGETGAPSDAGDAGCTGAKPVALTVKNYLSWCSVTVAGQAASTAASQTVCVASGPVTLSASALPGFVLGPAPWHDTSGDHDAGDPGTFTDAGQNSTSATTVTVTSGSQCVWVCCPTAGVANDCPTTNLCP